MHSIPPRGSKHPGGCAEEVSAVPPLTRPHASEYSTGRAQHAGGTCATREYRTANILSADVDAGALRGGRHGAARRASAPPGRAARTAQRPGAGRQWAQLPLCHRAASQNRRVLSSKSASVWIWHLQMRRIHWAVAGHEGTELHRKLPDRKCWLTERRDERPWAMSSGELLTRDGVRV